jgi:hypothetical protein
MMDLAGTEDRAVEEVDLLHELAHAFVCVPRAERYLHHRIPGQDLARDSARCCHQPARHRSLTYR